MKKIFTKIIATLFLGSVMTGCFDLDYENYSKISSEDFPKSETDLEAATIGVYANLGQSVIAQYLNDAGWTLNTLCTDELNTSWGDPFRQTDNFLWAANNMSASIVYTEYNKGITKATRIIDAFERSTVEPTKRDLYIAELRALRALYANYLYSMFGPLPIVTDPKIANDVYSNWKPERPTKEAYVSFMTSELEDTYQKLVKTQTSENIGRLTQGAALTLLMKIYLNDKQWQKAADAAQKVIDLNEYSLMYPYKAVFDIANEGKSNTEAILAIQRLTSNDTSSWTYFACVMPAAPAYKPLNGVKMEIWGGLKMPWAFYDKYEAGDERLQTIIRYYTDVDGNEVDFRQVDHPKATGAAPMKYSEDPEQKGSIQGNDFIVFRYADVLLSRAEALNELNGPSKEVTDLINQVRQRSRVPLLDWTKYTKETLRDFLLDERGRELYCEGHRRDDLIRFGKFIEKALEEGKDAKPYHVLYPIPQGIMNENPNLVQNPGY